MSKENITGLVAHWPFESDLDDRGPSSLPTANHNVSIEQSAARFNGEDSYLEIPNHPTLQSGTGDFSVALRIDIPREAGDVIGDLLSTFDSGSRRGWTLNVVTNTGVTSTAQANYRHLHFGIDNGQQDTGWTDCGRPGKAAFIYSLAAIRGHLYAGTFELEADGAGHLWRYSGNGAWEDLGATPNGCNAIPSVVDFEGAVYCSTGRYNPVGSRLGPPQNTKPGGHVYRVENGEWIDCGVPGSEDAVPESTPTSGYETGKADQTSGLTVYRGQLYATSFHRRGAFRYEGGQKWTYIGPNERLMTFAVYRDRLYTLVNGGPVLRYEGGTEWTHCGTPGHSDQTYAAVTYKGDMLVGTWPECEVQRYLGEDKWENVGRVGYEREVMAMALYNSKVYLGTLPMANAWRLDDDDFTYIGNLDNSPEVFLRRVWSMAVYQGKLYAGTLPAGRVLSFEAGRMATYDHALPAGQHHVAAVRSGNKLKLYLDGEQVAESSTFEAADFDLSNDQPLKIGFGPHQYFHGSMSDLRLYNRALEPAEIAELAQA